MKTKMDNTAAPGRHKFGSKKMELQGYLQYPASEDIYRKFREQKDIDPEELSKRKKINECCNEGSANEKDFNDDKSGGDLDGPGSGFEDQMEMIVSEDEENSFYSLGGDDHCNLDED